MTEQQAREALVEFGRSLFLRGYSCGTSGNLSVRLPGDGGFLMSPTNISLGRLDAGTISRLDVDGRHVDPFIEEVHRKQTVDRACRQPPERSVTVLSRGLP